MNEKLIFMDEKLICEVIQRIHPYTLTRALTDTCRFVLGGMEDCDTADQARLSPLWTATEQLSDATDSLWEEGEERVEVWYDALQRYTTVFMGLFNPLCDVSKPEHAQIDAYDTVVTLIGLLMCRGFRKPVGALRAKVFGTHDQTAGETV